MKLSYQVVCFCILFSLAKLSNAQQSDSKPGTVSIINKNWQTGGILEGYTPQQEILEKRTEFTKKFDKGNGVVDIIFGGPFHYKDATGAWQDIDLNIKTQQQQVFKYVSSRNQFTSRFADNVKDGVQMDYQNKVISFGLNPVISAGSWTPASSAGTSSVSLNENKITYKDIYRDVDMQYEVNTGMVQHQMVFKDAGIFSGVTSQQFVDIDEIIQLPANAVLIDAIGKISNNRAIKGDIYVTVSDDTLFTILPSRIWDASFKGNTLSPQLNSDELVFTETSVAFLSDNRITYSAKIPVKWLLEQNRAWPVIFDPTVSIGGNGSLTYGSGFGFRYPWRTNYRQLVSQTIYLQSEINIAGNITDVAYRQGINNGLVNSNPTIKCQTTANSTFSAASFLMSGWNSTFTASSLDYRTGAGTSVICSNPTPTWRTISLTNPFSYNNIQNLVIETKFQNATSSTDGSNCSGNPGSCCVGGGWYYYTRNNSIVHGACDCNSTYPTATLGGNAPVIKMTIVPTCTTPGIPATATANPTGQTTANLSWTAGTPAGSSTVTYYWVVGTSPTVTYGNGIADGTTTGLTATATGLVCGTQYYFRVYAKTSCDGSSSAYKTSSAFNTSACTTTCVTPGTPATATVSTIGQTSANLSWTAGSPAGSPTVTYYWVVGTSPTVTYGNGIDQGTSTTTSAAATGLNCATQYYLRVYAKTSCNGSISSYKTSAPFNTQACNTNCTTPGTPTNASGNATGQTTATISWSGGSPAGSPAVTYYWVAGLSYKKLI